MTWHRRPCTYTMLQIQILHLNWGLLLSSALPNSPLIFPIVLCSSIDPQLNSFLTPILPIISILSWLLQIPWFSHTEPVYHSSCEKKHKQMVKTAKTCLKLSEQAVKHNRITDVWTWTKEVQLLSSSTIKIKWFLQFSHYFRITLLHNKYQ